MNEVTREKLPALQGLDARHYATWLSAGLYGYLHEGLGRNSFEGAVDYVGWMYDVTDELADIFNVMNAIEQGAFQVAVALAFAEVNFNKSGSVPVAEALIRLSAKIVAPQILDSVPAKIAGLGSNLDAQQHFLRLGLDLAIELAVPTQQARQCLEDLAGSSAMRPAAAPAALLALCRADPVNLLRHLRLLKQHLDQRLGWAQVLTEEEMRREQRSELIAAVFELVPRQVFRNASNPLQRITYPSSIQLYNDWWFDTIMKSPGTLLSAARSEMISALDDELESLLPSTLDLSEHYVDSGGDLLDGAPAGRTLFIDEEEDV